MEDEESLKQINIEISNLKDIPPISGISDSSYKDFSLERSRQQKLEKAIYYAKILNISILNPDIKLRTIVINALGCENSLRNCKDGVTFFGSKKKEISSGQIINDVVLPFVSKDLAKNYRGKHFQIFYELSKDSYYIKDLKLGFGTFYKLTKQYELKHSTLFLLGDSFILVNFIYQDRELPRLVLKVTGKGSADVFNFSPSDYSENYLTIGREKSCEVWLQGSLISKVHCTIYFSPEKGWILCDGDLSISQPSTNGT